MILITLLVFSTDIQARDTQHNFSIQDALNSKAFEGRLNQNIKLYFGNESHPKTTKSLGDFVTNKKTNAFGKSDQKACEWAFLSALLTLEERAVAEGGNAVVNIRSFYKQNEVSSSTEFECHTGLVVAGVTLKGTIARIEQ